MYYIYGMEDCPKCYEVVQLLKKLNLEFEQKKYTEMDPDMLTELSYRNCLLTAPLVKVVDENGKMIDVMDGDMILKELRKLYKKKVKGG